MKAERHTSDLWQVTVQVPMRLPVEMRDKLFNAVTEAVAAWEPTDRDGWDADVSGAPARDPELVVTGVMSLLNGHLVRIGRMCIAGAPLYLIIAHLRRLADLMEYVDRPVSLTPAPGSHA